MVSRKVKSRESLTSGTAVGSHTEVGISLLFIYNNSRLSQSRIRNQETYLWFWSKLASNQVQGLHLNKGGEGDSLVQGDLGVLSGLEKYRVTIQ